MKQAVYFAGACAGIVLWHLPTTAACFARTVEGSYTCAQGGAAPAPTHASGTPFVSSVPTVPVEHTPIERASAERVFSVERVFGTPTSTSAGAFDVRDTFGPLTGLRVFSSGHEPFVEPR